MNHMHDLGYITRNGRGHGHHSQTFGCDDWQGLHQFVVVVWVVRRFEKEFAGFVKGNRIAFLKIWSTREERYR